MDEAQAEEAAVRAFGDPEEVGEKLWQANRKRMLWRMSRRAAIRLVGLWALIVVALQSAQWVADWGGTHRGPVAAGLLILLAVLLIYFFSRRFLPKTAWFGLAYLRWLVAAFRKSVGVTVHHPWIRAFVLACVCVTASHRILVQSIHHKGITAASASPAHENSSPENQRREKQPVVAQSKRHLITATSVSVQYELNQSGLRPTKWDFLLDQLARMQPQAPFGAGGLLAIAYLLFAARAPRLMQSEAEMSRLHAYCWNAAFILGACVSIAMEVSAVWVQVENVREPGMRFFISFFSWMMPIGSVGALPFFALEQAVFLAVVVRAVRDQPLSVREVVKTASNCLVPFLLLCLIGEVLFVSWYTSWAWFPASWARLRAFPSVYSWYIQIDQCAQIVIAFALVVVISDQCGIGFAFARLATFVWRYFWRCVVIVLLACFPSLVLWLVRFPFGDGPESLLTHLGIGIIFSATLSFFGVVLTVMFVEFYLTRAGTVEPTTTEEAAAQVPSE